MTGSIRRDRSGPDRGDMIPYHSLTSNSTGYVDPLTDPPPPGDQYEEKWTRKRLAWGFGEDQFISDVTPLKKAEIDRRRRLSSLRSGMIFSIMFVSFIVILLGSALGWMDGSVLATIVTLFVFLIITAVAGRVFIERGYKQSKEYQRKKVQIPDCVIELTDKYLSIMFKGTSNSDEYMIYYDQIKGVELWERDITFKRAPLGTSRKVKIALDPTMMPNTLYPPGTPKDHVIKVSLKDRIKIDKRKVMTLHFKRSSEKPRGKIISNHILISIRPEEQRIFIERLRNKLDDTRSYEGQEFYPAWK